MQRCEARGRWAPTVLAFLLLAASGGIVAFRQMGAGGDSGTGGADPQWTGYLDRLVEQGSRPPRRLVYPYSVIPGGVASPEELAEAMLRDEVVARHYAGFDARRGRTLTLREPRVAYVSYRVKDQVFFTRKPVRLFAGEQIITDGKTTIRARCGNKVEDAPQAAVSAEEPAEEILNTPKLEAEPERPPLGAPGLTDASPAQETPLAAVAPPPGFTPLDTPVRGPGAAWLTPPPPGVFVPPSSQPGPGGTLPPPPPGAAQPDLVAPPPAVGPPPVPAPPASPPGVTPPGTPPAVPPAPPGAPPATPPGAPPGSPPTGGVTPPPESLPPPVLPTPPSDPWEPPEIPIPPPDVTPPPDVPEPPEIPEPSTYGLVAIGLMLLPVIRGWKRQTK